MFFKILLVGVSIVVLMVVAQNQRWPARAGITGTCWAIQAPVGKTPGAWYACKQGILTSFPSLEAQECTSAGMIAHDEIWECTGPLVSLPSY